MDYLQDFNYDDEFVIFSLNSCPALGSSNLNQCYHLFNFNLQREGSILLTAYIYCMDAL